MKQTLSPKQICFEIVNEVEFDFIELEDSPILVFFSINSNGDESEPIIISQN